MRSIDFVIKRSYTVNTNKQFIMVAISYYVLPKIPILQIVVFPT